MLQRRGRLSSQDTLKLTSQNPFAEPSVFASPPPLTPTTSLASTASSSASPKTTMNEPAAAAGNGRSNSLGYWSIYSSASGSSTYGRPCTVSSTAGTSEADETLTLQTKTIPTAVVVAAGGGGTTATTRKPSLPSLQMTAARTRVTAGVPSGLVQAIPLSPLAPPHAQELQPRPRAAAALLSRPSQLTLAHLASANPPPLPLESARPAVASSKKVQQGGRGGATNSDRLDLTRLRREQLARRRAAAVEFELEDDCSGTSHSDGGGGDEAKARVAAPAPAPRTARTNAADGGRHGESDPAAAAEAWEDEVSSTSTVPPRRRPVERSERTTLPFPLPASQGASPWRLQRMWGKRGGPRL